MVAPTNHGVPAGEFPNEIIRASAGTGKTFALSNRYLKLLACGAECQTILATTFTKKGAGEILDRIINRLSGAALDEAAAAELSEHLELAVSRERAAEILADLLHNLHRLEISTLDSFFNRVAKAFSLELGLPPTWDIVDEQEINQMEDEAIQTVLRNETVIDLLHMLSKGEASRPVSTLVRQTVKQIYSIFRESGTEPWDQLSVSGKYLTHDELEMLKSRAEAVVIPGKRLPEHWERVKEVLSAEDWLGLVAITSFQNAIAGDYRYSRSKLPLEVVEIYQALIPHCRAYVEELIIRQNRSTRDLLIEFGELLEQRKDLSGNLRFDDVTDRLQTFVSMWDTDRFAFRLDHQIQHLLLDEFQDTSLSQWNVIRPFAQKVTALDDALRSFFCVGDMKQAIFGWRGGVAEIFDLVDEELPNLQAQQLSASYRSSQPVIDLVNDVFLHVEKYACKDPLIEAAIHDWPKWFQLHTTKRESLQGYVTIEMAADCSPELKQIEDTKDRKRNENVIRSTVERIRRVLASTPDRYSIGVIVRTNKEVNEIIFALQQAEIPASEEGGSPLTDSAAVELVLSALTLADHPGDSLARFHLSHSPLASLFDLQPETLATQTENAQAAHAASPAVREALVADGYGATVERFARMLLGQCTEREASRLQQLVQVAYESSTDGQQWQLRPSRFVQYVREEVKVSDKSSARVRVMTIHKSKGLEFDVVVLPFKLTSKGWAGFAPNYVVGRETPTAPIKIATRYAGEGLRKLLPEEYQELFEQDRQRTVRESMCVLYVGLTRAKHATHVVLSYGAKPDHKSAAGIVLATVCPDARREEGMLYEAGNPQWYQSPEKQAEPDPFGLSHFYRTPRAPEPGVIDSRVHSGRGVNFASPSSLAGGHEVSLGTLFTEAESADDRRRGRLIHGCFEAVHWLDEAVPAKPELEQRLRAIEPSQTDFDRPISQFYAMLEWDNVRTLLSRGSYQELYLLDFAAPADVVMEANRLELHNERRFAAALDDGILEGVIDRLVLVYQGETLVAADVIDFKSDAVDESTLQAKIEYYRPQLEAYRRAVSQFAGLALNRIAARLVFVETGQVVNLNLVENSFEVTDPAHKSLASTAKKRKSKKPQATAGTPAESPGASESRDSGVPVKKHRSPKTSPHQKTFWD